MKTSGSSLIFLMVVSVLWAQEKQVSLDNRGKVNSITAELERNLHLFDDYPDFKEANVFQLSDSSYYLEISSQRGGLLTKNKSILSNAELQKLRDTVSLLIDVKVPHMILDQSGRTLFLIGNSILGFYYGTALSALLKYDEYKLAVATTFLTAGASYFIPAVLTKKSNVSYSHSFLGLYGQTRGIIHGFLLSDLIDIEFGTTGSIAFSLAGSIIEGMAGFKIAEKNDFTPGRSAVIGTYGDFGMGIGALTFGLLDSDKMKWLDAFAFVGSLSGLLIGRNLSSKTNYTWGDACMLTGVGLLGAYVPFSVLSLFPNASTGLSCSMIELGTLFSLGIGHTLAKKYDFSSKEGLFIDLSESAGGLLGAGIGYLLSNDYYNDLDKTILICTGIGALTGFLVSTAVYSRNAKVVRKSILKDVSFNIHLNPVGLSQFTGIHTSNMTFTNNSLLTANIRF